MNVHRNKLTLHTVLAISGLAISLLFLLSATASAYDTFPGKAEVIFEAASLSALFLVSSTAFLQRRNWGRLLFSAILQLLVIVLVGKQINSAWKLFSIYPDIAAIAGAAARELVSIVPFVVIIVLLHSQKLVDEMNCAEGGG